MKIRLTNWNLISLTIQPKHATGVITVSYHTVALPPNLKLSSNSLAEFENSIIIVEVVVK